MGSFYVYLFIDFLVDVKDVMGVNMINLIFESVVDKLWGWFFEEEILFSILSNFVIELLVFVCCEIFFECLGRSKEIGE